MEKKDIRRGETEVRVTRNKNGETVSEHGTEEHGGAESLSHVAEVYVQLSRKWCPVQFESMEVVVGTRIPCLIDDIISGAAYRSAFRVTEKELKAQIEKWEKKSSE